MATPARFPNGITNGSPTSAMNKLGILDPTRYHTFMDDFDKYNLADYIITTVELGAGSATEAIGDLDGGVLVLTNAAGATDSDFLQIAKSAYTFTAGKKLFFKARLKLLDAVNSAFVMGLQIRDTTPLAVSDGVFFQKVAASALLDVHASKASTVTSAAGIHTMVSNTYLTVAFAYNGSDKIEAFVDNIKVATLVTTNLPDTQPLTVSFGVANGAAVANVMSTDFIMVAKER